VGPRCDMRRYTPAEMRDILARIAPEGVEGVLWLPNPPPAPPSRGPGPSFCVYARHSDLVAGTPDIEGQYWRALKHTHAAGAIRALALINGILSDRRATDPEVHRVLNERFLPDDLRAKMYQHKPGGPDFGAVFNVIGCLQLARHLILYGGDTAGSAVQDVHRLSELVLFANEFTQPTPPFKSAQPSSLQRLLSILPVWDVCNPRDLAYTLSRMLTILTEILPGTDPKVRGLVAKLGMSASGIKVGCLPLNDFVSAVFGLYVYGQRMATVEPDCAVFDPHRVFSQVGFPEEILLNLIADRALTISEFRERLAGGTPHDRRSFAEEIRQRQFLTDSLNLFRQFPLLRLGENRILIFHLQFLVELLTSGVYWSVFDGLPQGRRETFRELWGRVFELYVAGLLNEFYPSACGILTVDRKHSTGQVDALLGFVDDVFVLETKASLLTERAKRGGEEASFVRDFNLKFVRNERGEPKGILQLAASCKAVQDGKIPTVKRPARIYPVLVSEEPAVEAAFFNTFANEVFQREATPGPRIMPITVMSISELEEILPYSASNDLSWREILNSRFTGTEVGPFSVHQAVYDLSRRTGINPRRNEALKRKFDWVWETIISRYRPQPS